MRRVPIGPHFAYEDGPDLFLGRVGEGPLNVVWDTNVLLDYLTYGADLWEGREPQITDEGYYAEVEALGVIIAVWQLRDVRFHILPRTVTDARRKLSQERRDSRIRALDAFVAALRLIGHFDSYDDDHEDPGGPPFIAPAGTVDVVLMGLPDGADRDLVQQALKMDAHVFLTRDRQLLQCRSRLGQLGLLVASPLDLLEELAAFGALLCMVQPEYLYWPLPDSQRMSHLIDALGECE